MLVSFFGPIPVPREGLFSGGRARLGRSLGLLFRDWSEG